LLSRTTYATLFSIVGTTYGAGDGSTTFAIPDLRGRVPAGVDDVGNANRLTTALSGVDGHTLGAVGGTQNQAVARDQLPNVTLSYSNSISVTSNDNNIVSGGIVAALNGTGLALNALANATGSASSRTSTGTSSGNTSSINGGVTQNGLIMVQPTIVCNYIMRII
jgi:microcystin-dependent protein